MIEALIFQHARISHNHPSLILSLALLLFLHEFRLVLLLPLHFPALLHT